MLEFFSVKLLQHGDSFVSLQEVLERAAGEQEEEGGREEDKQTFISPLEVLDQLIVHGHNAHEGLSRRSDFQEQQLEECLLLGHSRITCSHQGPESL